MLTSRRLRMGAEAIGGSMSTRAVRPPAFVPALRDRFVASRWAVPAIFALALLLRLALAVALPQAPLSDGAYYVDRATELAAGLGYQEGGIPTAYWPIGFPALLAAGVLLFGSPVVAAVALNLVAAAAILWLILWFGRTLAGSEFAARVAALLYAVYPAHIAYTGAPLSETTSTAVSIAAFALLIAARRDWRGLVIAGLLFGAATLMRAQMMLFPAGALIAIAIVYRDFGWRDMARAALVVHLALAAVVLPWSLRNLQVLDAFVPVSTNGGISLYYGANDHATGDWYAWDNEAMWTRIGIPYAERVERQVEADRRWRGLAQRWIAAHPAQWSALGVKKMGLLWYKDSDGFWSLSASYPALATPILIAQAANQLFYLAVLALAAVCLWAATVALIRGDATRRPLALLFCVPLFATLTAFAFTGQIRYHYPAMPFLLVAAGWTLARFADRRSTA